MAKIYSNSSGRITSYYIWEEDASGPDTDTAYQLEFDPQTNQVTVNLLNGTLLDNGWLVLIGTVLTYKGTPVIVNSHSAQFADRKDLAAIRQILTTYYNKANPTQSDTVAALKAQIRLDRVILDYYLAKK